MPTQFWPESLKNTDNFGDHGNYITMYLNWISTLADKLPNNGIKLYEHFQKEHIYKIWKVLNKEKKGKCREKHANKFGTKMIRNMSCWGKNTGRNETGRTVRRQRPTDAETCLLDSSHISSPFNHTCNKTLPTGISPDRLNCSIIKPLYTGGNKHDVSNYGLTSLLTSFSKLFGKIMPSRFKGNLTKDNILSIVQRGFRTNLTRGNGTYTLTNVISNALNKKLAMGGIFVI